MDYLMGVMTMQDYFQLYDKEIHDRPGLRLGQSAFNVLACIRPDLAERVRTTDLDPFNDDNRLPAFFGYLTEQWDNDDRDN